MDAEHRFAAVYANQALALARRIHYRQGEGEALNRLGAALRESNLARALEVFQQSLRIAEATKDQALMAQNLRSIGIIYVYLRDKPQALAYYLRALKIGERLHDDRRVVIELSNIGLAYDLFGPLDSAQLFQERALRMARRLHTPTNYILYGLGNVARKRGEVAKARIVLPREHCRIEKGASPAQPQLCLRGPCPALPANRPV